MATAIRRGKPAPALGYRYPSAYRHDTRVGTGPRPIYAPAPERRRREPSGRPKAPPVQPRKPWAIKLEREVAFVWTGLRAGALAGAFMAAFDVPALLFFTGRDPLLSLYAAAWPVLGADPLRAAMDDPLYLDWSGLLVGLAVHLTLAACFGAIFGQIVRRDPPEPGRLLTVGIVYGVSLMAAVNLCLLPLLGGPALPAVEGWSPVVATHALYGFILGCWPLVRRQDFAQRPRLKVVARR